MTGPRRRARLEWGTNLRGTPASRAAAAGAHHSHFELDGLKGDLVVHVTEELQDRSFGHGGAVDLDPQRELREFGISLSHLSIEEANVTERVAFFNSKLPATCRRTI